MKLTGPNGRPRTAVLLLAVFLSSTTLTACHELYCNLVEGLTGVPVDCSHDAFPDLGDIELPPLPPPPSLPTTTTTTAVPATTTTQPSSGTTTTTIGDAPASTTSTIPGFTIPTFTVPTIPTSPPIPTLPSTTMPPFPTLPTTSTTTAPATTMPG